VGKGGAGPSGTQSDIEKSWRREEKKRARNAVEENRLLLFGQRPRIGEENVDPEGEN